MFPIILDTTQTRFMLVGTGQQMENREQQLREAGAINLKKFSSSPEEKDIRKAHIVYITGLPENEAKLLAGKCRELGVLVNVEDVTILCDFHTPSLVRRGDLLISISTGGKSPALTRILRRHLKKVFGTEWGERLNILADKRQGWKARGDDIKTVTQNTEKLVVKEKWLK